MLLVVKGDQEGISSLSSLEVLTCRLQSKVGKVPMVVPFTTPDSTLHSLLRLTCPRQVEMVYVNTADGYITCLKLSLFIIREMLYSNLKLERK